MIGPEIVLLIVFSTMRLICPSCAAVYEVPFQNLKPGRRTRCARCSAMWIPLRQDAAADDGPPAPEAGAPPAGFPDDPSVLTAAAASGPDGATAMDRLAAYAAVRPPRALHAAWAASIVVLAGSALAAYVWREPVVRAWPQSGWVLGTQPVAAASANPGGAHGAEPPETSHSTPSQ
jgi:predicted Zn finger-like uncharacterized protein